MRARLRRWLNRDWKWADFSDVEWEPDNETLAAINRLESP